MAMVTSINQLASALESARNVTLEAAAVATSKLGESSYTNYSQNLSNDQIIRFLNSRNTREVKDAMKRIIAAMVTDDTVNSINVESFFPDVLKNITSNDCKVKRLVYIYLLRFAETNPDLSLLTINSIQKLLNESDPKLRSFSVRALSDIKIDSLLPILLHTLKKFVNDSNAMVRSEVAFALIKLKKWNCNIQNNIKDTETADNEEFEDSEYDDTILELLNELSADSDPAVVSSAIKVWKLCFPYNLSWLHGHFRYYCSIITQLDPWSQVDLIDFLIKYCKTYLKKPIIIDNNSTQSIELPNEYNKIPFISYNVDLDPDLSLFLLSLNNLKFSPNPLVIISCCQAFWQLSTPQQLKNSMFLDALFRCFIQSENINIKISILQVIYLYSSEDNTFFRKYLKSFIKLPNDTVNILCWKLKVLSTLVDDNNIKFILTELKYYLQTSTDDNVIIATVNTLASCSSLSLELRSHIIKWLVKHMETSNLSNVILDCYITTIRKLIIMEPLKHLKIIIKLSQILQDNYQLADNARAGLIWLFGEIANVEFRICPDVLRNLIPKFAIEGEQTRNSILLFAAKLLSHEFDQLKLIDADSTIAHCKTNKMFQDILYLSKFDDSLDIRDRARWISSIFDSNKFQIATLLFQAQKPLFNISDDRNDYDIIATANNNKNDSEEYYQLHNLIKFIPWNDNIIDDENNNREPAPLKDYNKYKKSLSSNSFISGNTNMSRNFNTPVTAERDNFDNNVSEQKIGIRNNNFTSSTGQKYKLQSLDEFFADVPISNTKHNDNKKVKLIEESESESESESGFGSGSGSEYETDSETDSEIEANIITSHQDIESSSTSDSDVNEELDDIIQTTSI